MATIQNAQRTLILAKTEVNYGVDPTPTPASNAILTTIPEITPIAENLAHEHIKPYFGRDKGSMWFQGWELKFGVQLRGNGSAVDTAPAFGCLLQSAGLTETVTPATNVVYSPNSLFTSTNASKSVTIWCYLDTVIYKVTGCVTDIELECDAGNIPMLTFTAQGLYATPIDGSYPAATAVFSQASAPPRFINAAMTLDSYAAITRSIKFKHGADIQQRQDINDTDGIKEYYVNGFEPELSLTVEHTSIAAKNYYDKMSTAAQMAFTCTFAGLTGNNFVLAAPKCRITEIKPAEENGIQMLDLTLALENNAGNDCYTLTCT